MTKKVKLGAVVGTEPIAGKHPVEVFHDERIGDWVLPWRLDLESVRQCVRFSLPFMMFELEHRGTLAFHPEVSRETLAKIRAMAGPLLLGRCTIGESGGLVYWPRAYLKPPEEGGAADGMLQPLKAGDMREAAQLYVQRIQEALARARKLDDMPLGIIDPGFMNRYHIQGGCDWVGQEFIFDDHDQILTAAARGALRAGSKNLWLADVAVASYAGGYFDELYFHRVQSAYYYMYMSGADLVLSEEGHFGLRAPGAGQLTFDDPLTVRYRDVLRKVHAYYAAHPLPVNGPLAKIAVMLGTYDGDAGLWGKWIWGQERPGWRHGPAEWSTALAETFYTKTPWHCRTNRGNDDVSANPPFGTIDLVPAETPLPVLSQYAAVVFLGWNTMTETLYEKLKRYVAQGGHLCAAVPHLSTAVQRQSDFTIIHGGDVSDLFGVRIKGQGVMATEGFKFFQPSHNPLYSFPVWRLASDPQYMGGDVPLAEIELQGAHVLAASGTRCGKAGEQEPTPPVLVEHKLGKGYALLLTTWCYPGLPALQPLAREILRVIKQAHQDFIRLEGPDMVRYSVFEENGRYTVLILNTDAGCPACVRLHVAGRKPQELMAPPSELLRIDDIEKP